jgi:N-sulfoglucosamine sulfohydrolase
MNLTRGRPEACCSRQASALLPESEIVKRSEDAGKTIYELVRDPSLYDLQAYQQAAALALEQNPSNVPTFYKNLNNADAGVRYWAIVGCFIVQENAALDMEVIKQSLKDESHHVRIMAAWILYRGGEKNSARACWNDLLQDSSYASLKIFNIIDWIGDGHEPYVDAMTACNFSHGGYVGRMQEYMGVAEKEEKKKKRNRKKK